MMGPRGAPTGNPQTVTTRLKVGRVRMAAFYIPAVPYSFPSSGQVPDITSPLYKGSTSTPLYRSRLPDTR